MRRIRSRILIRGHKKLLSLEASLRRLLGIDRVVRFVVVAHPRTGSNLLVSMLSSHPKILARGEVMRELAGRSPNDLFEEAFRRDPAYLRAVGFKLLLVHPLDDPGKESVRELFAMTDLVVIQLKRRNTVRALTSLRIAMKRNVWKMKKDHDLDAIDARRVRFEVEELRALVDRHRQTEANNEALFLHHARIEVFYEDLVRQPDAELARIFEFLRLGPVKPVTPFRRQNPEPLRDLIENFEELSAALEGTEIGDMLRE